MLSIGPTPGQPASSSRSNASTRTSKPAPQRPIQCMFCKGEHWSDTCPKFTTIEARLQQIPDKCVKCFRLKHDGNCISERRYAYCDSKDHNRALCPHKFGKQTTLYANVCTESGAEGAFWTLLLQVSSTAKPEPRLIRAVIDSGGAKSIILTSLATDLGLLTSKQSPLQLQSLGQTTLPPAKRAAEMLQVHTPDNELLNIQTYITSSIADDLPAPSIDAFRRQYPQFDNIPIPHTGAGKKVDLLFGKDSLMSILTLAKSINVSDTHQLLSTKFGWLIVSHETEQHPTTTHSQLSFQNATNEDLHNLWELDRLGLTYVQNKQIDAETAALKKFYSSIEFRNNRYYIELPFIQNPPLLDENFGLAFGRLKTLWHKLKKHPGLLEAYNEIIQQQLTEEIIETVPLRSQQHGTIVHYIPHHPVVRPDSSSTKTRIVYDASARTHPNKRSLNENLYKGTNWVEEIFAVLLRFRRYPTAIVADIAKAFLQIGIKSENRDALRFLWLRRISEPPSTENLLICRFTRIAFGVISSPFLLNATITHHLTQLQHPHTERLLQDLYADNLVCALPPEINPVTFYNEIKTTFGSMSMNMMKWAVNTSHLREHIPKSDQAEELTQSVLGLKWHVEKDTLTLKSLSLSNSPPKLTKRHVLREYAKVFDPLGWATPITLLAKIYLRQLWNEKVKWDEPLSTAFQAEWEPILTQLRKTENISLARTLQQHDDAEPLTLEIHAFVDASAQACAVVVYARLLTQKSARLAFLASKSRLTPARTLTIPRLELLALLLGARFATYIREKLKWHSDTNIHMWSDSKCIIAWTKTTRILPTMVAKQIEEYHSYAITDLHYIPSEQNMADVATRGATVDELHQMGWWDGPTWLKCTSTWPINPNIEEDSTPEPVTTLFTPEQNSQPQQQPVLGVCTLNITDFSTLSRLLKRTAFCLKAINCILKKKILPLEADLDYALALQYWLLYMQKQVYPNMYDITQRKHSVIKNLRLFLDDNDLIRCQSRLQHASLEPNAITPILLGKRHPLTTLIILEAHQSNHHVGTAQTLAILRQRYWLPQGRREVYNTIKNHCYKCRKIDAKCFIAPQPAPLPEFRVNQITRPFEATRIDTFGPLYTRTIEPSMRATKNKRWVLLFTCTVTRAIHLELLFEMNSRSILEAIQRFAARRGTPRLLVCDNAPQFRVIQNKLTNLWDYFSNSAETIEYFAQKTIKWKFLPPHAPWMGGHYERLIATIKKSLEKTYTNTVLIDRQLETSLIQIEGILNSRPLTYIDQHLDSLIVTPNHFLQLRFPAIPLKTENTKSDRSILALWNASQAYIENFWKHWSEQFLLALRDRDDKIKQKRNSAQTIPAVNDIVLIAEPPDKRCSWRLARVERVLPSADGQIRAVQLILGDHSRLIRPILKLAPLNLQADLPPPQFELTEDRTAIIVDDQPYQAPPESIPTADSDVEIEVELDWSSGED